MKRKSEFSVWNTTNATNTYINIKLSSIFNSTDISKGLSFIQKVE